VIGKKFQVDSIVGSIGISVAQASARGFLDSTSSNESQKRTGWRSADFRIPTILDGPIRTLLR
jgi:hypothetical protein